MRRAWLRHGRRWVGLALFALCLVPPAALLVFGPGLESLRLERGWAWAWELPGPLPWFLLGLYPLSGLLVMADLPALWRWRRAACVAIALGAVLLLGFGLLCAGIHAKPRISWQRRIAHLEDPGVFEKAAIVAHGRLELAAWLWAVPHGGGSWKRVSEPWGYPPCTWPLEVRKADGAPRYLLVDSEGRASALLDLSRTPTWSDPGWRVDRQLPRIEDLRREFGGDLSAVALWEDWD